VNEIDPYRKSIIVSDAAEWLASKTNATADDQLVRLLADILKTQQGEALVRWCLLQVEGAK
jgi:HD-GYP domain-containing protein (c-di-GMP phosphodiesterase class II)